MPKRKDNAPKTRGAYNQTVWTQATTGLKRGFKHMRHVPGDFVQLGGEFVLVPGYKAEFTHRMSTPANHMEFIDVLRHAGIPDQAFEAAAKAAIMPARIPSMASTTASMGASTLDRALEQIEAERDEDSRTSCAMPDLDDDDESDAETETEENEHELNRRFEEAMAHEQALAAKQARMGAGAPRSPPPQPAAPAARASQVGLAL
ncbi:uncharacterized protein LOC62_01G000202 [Vanrija pseudolonga]|uniref:Uncharacterized protein n=1 Tax=Vanrija pseudolonga TaxID=143232 RepID=A0AAF1BI12_9TREE|nr:hypothetical protein LOC62_01G000202 [Vanrija pseudolonga]